jgi:hypothetical protein
MREETERRASKDRKALIWATMKGDQLREWAEGVARITLPEFGVYIPPEKA